MIIDVARFVEAERPCWNRLATLLDRIESHPERRMDLGEIKEFHYLYERASADLAKVSTFAAEQELRRYLESLVSRAYGEVHETRDTSHRVDPRTWPKTFARCYRRQILSFWLALGITIIGAGFGGLMVGLDPEARQAVLPFEHPREDPARRVAEEEEEAKGDKLEGAKASFSAQLMTHNTKVSLLTLSTGVAWGIGTIILLFYNGVMLGAVSVDYVSAGQSLFLLGWLLPHGVIEIPAILISGQAGFVLARSVIGSGDRRTVRVRLRAAAPDVVTLAGGTAALLVWAGIVEAFLSQYHEPVLPYALKIAFGAAEMLCLLWVLAFVGRREAEVIKTEKPAGAGRRIHLSLS